jgi:hypothetical protein
MEYANALTLFFNVFLNQAIIEPTLKAKALANAYIIYQNLIS